MSHKTVDSLEIADHPHSKLFWLRKCWGQAQPKGFPLLGQHGERGRHKEMSGKEPEGRKL